MRRKWSWPLFFTVTVLALVACLALAECTVGPPAETPTTTPGASPTPADPTPTATPAPTHPWEFSSTLAPTVTPVGGQGDCEGDWTLIWSDEFDSAGVDLSLWNVAEGADLAGDDAHYNAPEDAYVEDGHLVIRQQRREYGRLPYSSGKVTTWNRLHLLQGRVEVRATSSHGRGFLSLLRLVPADGSWPPEIVVSEVLGDAPGIARVAYVFGAPGNAEQVTDSFSQDPDAFHVYAVEWEPDETRWIVDGEEQLSTTDHVGEAGVPMMLVVETIVGGERAGRPNESTVFPGYRRVDYVRVYQRASCAAPSFAPGPAVTATPTATP